MARFILVGGEPQEEEPLFDLLLPFANNGRMVNFLHLDEEGTTIAFHSDARELNPAATQLAGGETVYGDAVIFRDEERVR